MPNAELLSLVFAGLDSAPGPASNGTTADGAKNPAGSKLPPKDEPKMSDRPYKQPFTAMFQPLEKITVAVCPICQKTFEHSYRGRTYCSKECRRKGIMDRVRARAKLAKLQKPAEVVATYVSVVGSEDDGYEFRPGQVPGAAVVLTTPCQTKLIQGLRQCYWERRIPGTRRFSLHPWDLAILPSLRLMEKSS